MSYNINLRSKVRKGFVKVKQVQELPDLLKIPKESYQKFLQANTPPDRRQI
jgi:hypothetical protein